jgi:hypothetical protein
LYDLPSAARSTTRTALFALTVGDHALTVPASPTKMKTAGAVTPFCVTGNACEPLKTIPVGDALPAAPGGIATTSVWRTPSPSYSVEVELWLLATQTNPCGLNAIPHGLTRRVSTFEVL